MFDLSRSDPTRQYPVEFTGPRSSPIWQRVPGCPCTPLVDCPMPAPSPSAQVAFLRELQRLLDEGQFTATYKFALLLALADLAVERGDEMR